VIIGGGVMGLSTAYHLASAGVTDVVLVEQGELGSGSTCKAAGGVRAQFSDRVNIELGTRSLRTFETFRETFGQEIDLHQVGYLLVIEAIPRRVLS
jgi:sarcosine oxidase subunit beta